MLWHKKDGKNGGDRRDFRKARKKQKSAKRKERSSTMEKPLTEGKLREWQPPSNEEFAPPALHRNEVVRSTSSAPENSEDEIWDTSPSPPLTPSSSRGGYRNYTIEVPVKEVKSDASEPRETLNEIQTSDNGFGFSDAAHSSNQNNWNKEEDSGFDFDDAEAIEPPLPDRDVVPQNVIKSGIDFDIATKVRPSDRLRESLKKARGN